MSDNNIDKAMPPDLRGSWPALQRAAQRARALAAQTGTELIVSRNGVMERIAPPTSKVAVQESSPSYGEKP